MYCEVVVKHRAVITEAGLQTALQGRLGVDILLTTAYGRSAIYRVAPPHHSVFAFETVRRCFVIVREVNSRFSTYHIEGNTPAVSVESLLASVQDFASLLLPVLATAPAVPSDRASSLTVQLFEDNGRETGMEGKLTTLSSVFREQFSWTSLRSAVIAFATGLLLIWRGLKPEEPLKASIYSFVIVLIFTLLESSIGYLVGRGKIRWKLRQG
jgi:hypothetical protein